MCKPTSAGQGGEGCGDTGRSRCRWGESRETEYILRLPVEFVVEVV